MVWGHVGFWGALWMEESIATECLIMFGNKQSQRVLWSTLSDTLDLLETCLRWLCDI